MFCLPLDTEGRFANRPYSARMIQHIIVRPQRATWRRHGGREEFWSGESHPGQEKRQVSLKKAMIPPIAAPQIFLFLLQFALLLASARLLSEVMKRYEQPPVFGELLAGMVFGPSLL